MCFDARSSMEAFIISSIGTSMLYFSEDKTKQKISYFWMSVTLIQLWEYFIWKNINNKEKNKFIAKFGSLNSERAAFAKSQSINKEILSNTSNI